MTIEEADPNPARPLHRMPPRVYNKDIEGHTTTAPTTLNSQIMRKIETQMNAAIANSSNWQSGNTSVHFNEEESISIVRLHGNKIAEIGEGFIRLFDGGWQTNTTKSRLNAILEANGADGDKVFQKNFDWFVQMDTRQGLTVVPFFSSMRLG